MEEVKDYLVMSCILGSNPIPEMTTRIEFTTTCTEADIKSLLSGLNVAQNIPGSLNQKHFFCEETEPDNGYIIFGSCAIPFNDLHIDPTTGKLDRRR